MKFGKTPNEIENERKRLMVYAFSLLGGVFLFLFGVVSLLRNSFVLAGILFCFFGTGLIAAYISKNVSDPRPVSHFVASVLFVLATYLLLSGGADGTGAFWTYAITMLMVLLVGPKAGTVYAGLYLAINSVFLFGSFSFVYDYSTTDSIRIIAASTALFVLLLASEWVRIGSYGAISEASETHRYLANTDPLTRLLNRNGLMVRLKEKDFEHSAIVTILDIDNFKNINDSYGHDFGDMVLVRLARLLKDNTKGGDLTARWGGEEFLIILFETNLTSAEALVNKIKNSFKKITFTHKDAEVSITFSAGLAILEEISKFEASVKLADQRLYEAKHLGRNRVVSRDQGLEINS